MERIWGQTEEGKIKFKQREKRLYPRGERSHRDFGNDKMKMLEFISLWCARCVLEQKTSRREVS